MGVVLVQLVRPEDHRHAQRLLVADHRRQRLANHLVLAERLVGHAELRKLLLRIDHLQEGGEKVGQAEGHPGLVFVLHLFAVGDVAAQAQLL